MPTLVIHPNVIHSGIIERHQQSSIGSDLATTVGCAAVGGALGTGAGYLTKPTADQFAKQALNDSVDVLTAYKKLFTDALEEAKANGFENLKPATVKSIEEANKECVAIFKATDVNSVDLSKIKSTQQLKEYVDILQGEITKATGTITPAKEAQNSFFKQMKTLFQDATEEKLKNWQPTLNQCKKSNMLLFGSIGAGALALIALLSIAARKDNN